MSLIRRLFAPVISKLKKLRMVEPGPQQLEIQSQTSDTKEAQKRKNECIGDVGADTAVKKGKLDSDEKSSSEFIRGKTRKVALILGYSGKGYLGIQINKPHPTIEGKLHEALLKVGTVPQEHLDTPKKMSFQRAARTDKGVSAVVNVVSLKMRIDIENLIEKLNSHLPKEIRIFTCIKATKSFDSKCQCTGRTYIYVLPTYALTPIDRLVKDEFRVTDEILETTSKILQHFKGTHNFHNYTSEIKPNQPQAKRYIRSFECGKPFVIDGTEYVILTVNGQSFIRHHIRKMIGITIAIVRGYCGEEVIEKSWGHKKVDIPKAPGLGLLLRSLEFDGYNRKWGRDGEHKPIEWSKYEEEILKFQEEYILPDIYKTEAEEKVMMQWMQTLVHHVFDYTEDDEGNEIYGRNRFEQKKKGDSADDTVVQVEGEKEDKNAEDVKKRDLDNEKIEESEDSPSVEETEVKMG